jgi:hypothetical protein
MTALLASNIEAVMASLYSLQISLINVHGGSSTHSLRDDFSQTRQSLKHSWEDIRAFLQKSHAFGGDVVMLNDSLRKESVEDCTEFLIEMATTSTQLLDWSKTLLADSESSAREFSLVAHNFEQVLCNSMKKEQAAQDHHQSSSPRAFSGGKTGRMSNPHTVKRS